MAPGDAKTVRAQSDPSLQRQGQRSVSGAGALDVLPKARTAAFRSLAA
jgi:hypothetical protein